jgi:ectoine hydroxylase-related dioxygenase (phytanoyl-CoA dioxygenase family)
VLTAQQRRFWADNGFLVLPGFAADEDLEAVRKLLHRIWEIRAPRIVVDDLMTGARVLLQDSEFGVDAHSFKVNDLYLEFDEVRRLSLGGRITSVLGELLGDTPVLVNSLNFERGSQQPYHVDSLFMTPKTVGNLAATWIALQDCHPDAGPLAYFPQSNHIVPFQFLGGGYHFRQEEMPLWEEYVFSEVERRSLEPQFFAARAGDLFIWSSNLLHGGSQIKDPGLTRHSLVSHFWTSTDCREIGLDLVPYGDAFWNNRPHQPVPSRAPNPAPEPDPRSPKRRLRQGLGRLVGGRPRASS